MQTASFAVVMNRSTWNSLPKDVQEVIAGMAREHSLWVGEYVDGHVADAVEWSKKNYGFELIRLPKDEYDNWHRKVTPIIENWAKDREAEGLPGKAFLDDLYRLKEKYEAQFGEKE